MSRPSRWKVKYKILIIQQSFLDLIKMKDIPLKTLYKIKIIAWNFRTSIICKHKMYTEWGDSLKEYDTSKSKKNILS